MAPITRCVLRGEKVPVLRPLSLLRIFALAAVLGALGFARVHLVFETQDLRIESRKLQRRYEELTNHVKTLRADVEHKRYATLNRQYAENAFGLVVCPPDRSLHAALLPTAVERWRGVAPIEGETSRAAESYEEHLLAMVGERVLAVSSLAFAAKADETRP